MLLFKRHFFARLLVFENLRRSVNAPIQLSDDPEFRFLRAALSLVVLKVIVVSAIFKGLSSCAFGLVRVQERLLVFSFIL